MSVNQVTVEQVDTRWAALMPPIVYESFRVYGPACFRGRYYRVVEYRVRGGGSGWGCEVWSSGRWLAAKGGPGGTAIMAAVPASPTELHRTGVDCSPIPNDYDALTVECEGVASSASEDAEPSAAADPAA